VDAHVAKTIAAKPELVQISTAYGGPKEGSPVLPRLASTAFATFVFMVALAAARPMQAQDAKSAYPNMAPVDQYLMERNAEIALARSAAPESISRDAEVMVFGRKGYETAIKGKNGFVCLVHRS
jgi:hypothetical protein